MAELSGRQASCLLIVLKMATSGHFGSPICAKINRVRPLCVINGNSIFSILYKMAARGDFVFPIDDKNHRVLVIWDLNGYGEYELNRCICDQVIDCTRVGVPRRRRRRRRRRNQKHIITEIFKFRGYNNNYGFFFTSADNAGFQHHDASSWWMRECFILIYPVYLLFNDINNI